MAAGRRKAGINRNPAQQVQIDAARDEKRKKDYGTSASDRRILKFLKESGY